MLKRHQFARSGVLYDLQEPEYGTAASTKRHKPVVQPQFVFVMVDGVTPTHLLLRVMLQMTETVQKEFKENSLVFSEYLSFDGVTLLLMRIIIT